MLKNHVHDVECLCCCGQALWNHPNLLFGGHTPTCMEDYYGVEQPLRKMHRKHRNEERLIAAGCIVAIVFILIILILNSAGRW